MNIVLSEYSSSSRNDSTDSPDSFSPFVPTFHYRSSRLQPLPARSIYMHVWSANTGVSMYSSPQMNVNYEFVPASPAVTRIRTKFKNL